MALTTRGFIAIVRSPQLRRIAILDISELRR
jgi:hypothetical protein